MFIVSEGIVFWGSVLVTEVSPNVWLLRSQTGIIVVLDLIHMLPPIPRLIMAVDPVP